jgi:hypothetical protein
MPLLYRGEEGGFMTFKRLLVMVGALCAVAVLTASVGAGAARTPAKQAINLSTNAAVKQYLRSLGISPRGVVIQRGARNYAGPNCPGKGWNCTRSQRVVQIATPVRVRASAGTRSFFAKPPPPGNVAKCNVTNLNKSCTSNAASCTATGGSSIDQSCTVVQSATGSTSNTAQVAEAITQSGPTLSASQYAQITQTSEHGSNTVQLDLNISQTATTGATSVSQSVTSAQNFNISQTSTDATQSIQVKETSTQSETATNSAATGTQYASGDLFGHFTQSSAGVSTAKIRQTHNITQNAAGPNVDQTALDPIKCCANQSGNSANTVGLIQNGSVQTFGDTTPNISAVYEADCESVDGGNCTVTETQNTNGTTSTNTSSGSTVDTSFNCTGSTCTQQPITFDGSPGTGEPPATLGPYSMTAFGPDSQPLGDGATGVSDPAGTIGFTPTLRHDKVGGTCDAISCWATWSNGYTGDVYDTTVVDGDRTQITITLPAGTKAFYFYAEPNQFAVLSVEATAQDGTTSGPISVDGSSGAKYFGFYATGATTLESITVTTSDTSGFAIGEFGINPAAPVIL